LRVAARHPVEAVPEFLVGYRLRGDGMSVDSERMFRSWRLAACLVARRPRLKARRWNFAWRLLNLAEQRVYRGGLLGAAALLAGALGTDPRRTISWLAYRAARSLVRHLRPPRDVAGIPFEDWDPRHCGPDDMSELRHWRQRFVRLDEKRIENLGTAGFATATHVS
jgi:hypothetical protein